MSWLVESMSHELLMESMSRALLICPPSRAQLPWAVVLVVLLLSGYSAHDDEGMAMKPQVVSSKVGRE